MITHMKAVLFGATLMGAALMACAVSSPVRAQGAQTGEISGTVTANRDFALSEASGNHSHICAVRRSSPGQGHGAAYHLHGFHPEGPLPDL